MIKECLFFTCGIAFRDCRIPVRMGVLFISLCVVITLSITPLMYGFAKISLFCDQLLMDFH